MMSNNGDDWETVEAGHIVKFKAAPAEGALYWKAYLTTDDGKETPFLNNITVEYWEE